MAETRGIRKVSENILAKGRAMIVTEKDKDKYNWDEIPDGSVFIDTKTGIFAVKLEGESDWVPAGIKNDGTISIAKDNINKVESFTIEQETVPDNPNEFIYTNSEGQQRHGVKEWNAAGTVLKGYIFTLEKGTYVMHKNHLQVTIDDVLHRSVATGGVEEISEKRFRMTEKLVDKMEITVEYSSAFRMGCPYPRFFMNNEVPEASEVGDFWLDTDASLEEGSPITDEDIEDKKKIGWDRIEGRPDTLVGYGITDKVSYEGHVHNAADIIGLPTSLPANGGHAASADMAITASITKKADTASMADMAINDGANRNIVATYLTKDGQGATGTWNIDISGRADSARKAESDNFGRNISSTYISTGGGTLKAPLNFGKNAWNNVGDNSMFGDINATGTFAIRGANGATTFALAKRSDPTDTATIKYDGDAIEFDKDIKGNILGNAASASSVSWNDVTDKPQAMKASGGSADTSSLTDAINNDTAAMSFHWGGKKEQPMWVWGGNDAANAYAYDPTTFSVAKAAKAGDSDKLSGQTIGTGAGQIVAVEQDGKISSSVIPTHTHNVQDLTDINKLGVFGSKAPVNAQENSIWFDTSSMTIKVYQGGIWKAFNAATDAGSYVTLPTYDNGKGNIWISIEKK